MKPKDAVKRLLTLLDEYEWPEEKDRQALRLAIDACLDQIEQVDERVRIVERYVPRPHWIHWGYESEPARWTWKPRWEYETTTGGTTAGSETYTVSNMADRSSFIGAATNAT